MKQNDEYFSEVRKVFSAAEWKFLTASRKFQAALEAADDSADGLQKVCNLGLMLLECGRASGK